MKYQQQLSYAAIFADLLKNRIMGMIPENAYPDAILPVPLHKKRLIKRGFNQSLEITRAVAKEIQLPVLLKTVRRNRSTLAQTNLSKKDRQNNIKGCFDLLRPPNHSHIVIIDDVITTGATVNELAKLLKISGVKTVGVWSLARADINQTR
jgi:ComF family protein